MNSQNKEGFGNFMRKGNLCMQDYNYSKAAECYNAALVSEQSRRKARDLYLDSAYNSLFKCYLQMAEYEKAEEYYDKIKTNHFKNKLNLAGLYQLTGRYNDIIKVLEGKNAGKEDDNRLICLGSAYGYKGNYEKAICYFDSVIDRRANVKDSLYHTALNNKAFILMNEKEYSYAVQLFKKSMISRSKNNPRRYQTMGNLALTECKLKQFQQALEDIDTALAWQKQHLGITHNDYIINLRKKGEILIESGREKDALIVFRQYFELERANLIRYFSTMTERERLAYWKSKKNDIAKCYALEGVSPDFLYQVALFSKSITLLANINFRKQVVSDPILQDKFNQLEGLRRRQKVTSDNTLFASLDKEANKLEKEILRENKDNIYASFNNQMKVKTSNIAEVLKTHNDVAIEFIEYKKEDVLKYAALVLYKSGGVKFCPMFSKEAFLNYTIQDNTVIDILNDELYEQINALYTNKDIAQLVWGNIVKSLPKSGKIYFAPSGILNRIGIEYMIDSVSNRSFKDVYRLSSTRTLLQTDKNSYDKVLIVGGVDYYDKSQYKSDNSEANRKTSDVLRQDKRIGRNGTSFEMLNGTFAETDSIKSFIKNADAICEDSATEDTVKSNFSNYDIVHLSTHGYTYIVNDDTPALENQQTEDLSVYRSGIILSGANKASATSVKNMEDGILSASEISELNLRKSNLVVLSACQTALGQENVDDGPQGLVRGLKKAGAKQIVASLWSINDEASRDLMVYFYKYISQGISPHEALRLSQEKLQAFEKKDELIEFSNQQKRYISNGFSIRKPYNSPCYWASFIIIDSLK